jgi:DNA-binding SARP family transcriptional activator
MPSTPPEVSVLVFGGLSVTVDGRAVDVGPPRHRALLAALVARGGWLAMGDVVDLLWSGNPPASAANQVQRIAGRLRRLFEPELALHDPGHVIASRGDSYALTLPAAGVDLLRFRNALAGGRFGEALTLAAAAPFADLPSDLRRAPIFSAIERQRVTAVVEALRPDALGGVLAGVVDYAAALADTYPFDERLHAALIVALAASGRRAEALSRFETCRRLLIRELGVDPGPELRRAQARALQTDSAAAPVGGWFWGGGRPSGRRTSSMAVATRPGCCSARRPAHGRGA